MEYGCKLCIGPCTTRGEVCSEIVFVFIAMRFRFGFGIFHICAHLFVFRETFLKCNHRVFIMMHFMAT